LSVWRVISEFSVQEPGYLNIVTMLRARRPGFDSRQVQGSFSARHSKFELLKDSAPWSCVALALFQSAHNHCHKRLLKNV